MITWHNKLTKAHYPSENGSFCDLVKINSKMISWNDYLSLNIVDINERNTFMQQRVYEYHFFWDNQRATSKSFYESNVKLVRIDPR